MRGRPRIWLCLGLAAAALAAPARAQEPADLPAALDAATAGLEEADRALAAGEGDRARGIVTRVYLDQIETIEGWYGPGAPHAAPPLDDRVAELEEAFHAAMSAEDAGLAGAIARAGERIGAVRAAAARVETSPGAAGAALEDLLAPARERGSAAAARTPEFAAILRELDVAEAAYLAGDRQAALRGVEHAYLERFEPLEPRLPGDGVARAERLIHLVLRPRLSSGAETAEVVEAFAALDATLLELDAALAEGGSFWFTAVSAFMIIVREGLEAVLLIGAILAYLGRVSSEPRHRHQVWVGVGLGVAASVGTWIVARAVVPVGGASRELIEGVTALVAVAVLLYVSHWLFRKTYIQDWKRYLEGKVGAAVAGGSALAMAGLAFAAVYREGFETVLFYQALMFDAGPGPVLAGFAPGLVLIVVVGAGIIRLGTKLPLRQVFGATNAILLLLAFVFLGKGLYNLQEAGLFALRPLPWAPDHPLLAQVLGIHPTVETLGAQAAFLCLLAGTWAVYRLRRPGRAVVQGTGAGMDAVVR